MASEIELVVKKESRVETSDLLDIKQNRQGAAEIKMPHRAGP